MQASQLLIHHSPETISLWAFEEGNVRMHGLTINLDINPEISCFLDMFLNTICDVDVACTDQEPDSEKKKKKNPSKTCTHHLIKCTSVETSTQSASTGNIMGPNFFLCCYLCTKLDKSVHAVFFSTLLSEAVCRRCQAESSNRWFAFITCDRLGLTAFSVTMETGN